jgi:hypothetical protein
MICLMEDKISSIEGSLGAALFIKASLRMPKDAALLVPARQGRLIRLIYHKPKNAYPERMGSAEAKSSTKLLVIQPKTAFAPNTKPSSMKQQGSLY